MEYFELTHTEERSGYTIKLYTAWEDTEPDWDFESDEERQELFDKINSGSLLWFVANVTATKAGVELADDYLGGCCYESIDEFLGDGCYEVMVQTVIDQANYRISELVKAA